MGCIFVFKADLPMKRFKLMTVLALGVIYSKGMEYVGLNLSGRQKKSRGSRQNPLDGKIF